MSRVKYPTQLFETFEPRALLSGNVIAVVVDGHLFIRGDDRDNAIQIIEGFRGDYRIVGDGDTLINGKSEPVELSGVRKDIRINLGLGENDLRLVQIEAPRDLRITAATDVDTIYLQGVSVGEDLRIHSGAGQDLINLIEVNVEEETRIDSGVGSDLVTADRSEFGGRFRLNAGHGRDTVFLGDSTFLDKKQIRGGPGDDLIQENPLAFNFDFRQGAQGWSAGFADYFTGRQQDHMLDSGIRDLPDELGEGTGFYISGKNITDDLFMYLTRELGGAEGVKPNTIYQVRFDITFGSDAPSGCSGIGGAPGESVYLKAGASRRAPQTITFDDIERLNVDHGQQSSSGANASVVSDIANGEECELPADYVSVNRRHVHTFLVQTNDEGKVHLIVGTDSGFEGTTSLYYQKIGVQLVEVAEAASKLIAKEAESMPPAKDPDQNPV